VLATQRMLLVLDNCEHVASSAPMSRTYGQRVRESASWPPAASRFQLRWSGYTLTNSRDTLGERQISLYHHGPQVFKTTPTPVVTAQAVSPVRTIASIAVSSDLPS
jgi:hypothetical protein